MLATRMVGMVGMVEDNVGTEPKHSLSLLLASDDGEDSGPGQLGQQHGRGADTAGRTEHENGLAGSKPTPMVKREVGRLIGNLRAYGLR